MLLLRKDDAMVKRMRVKEETVRVRRSSFAPGIPWMIEEGKSYKPSA